MLREDLRFLLPLFFGFFPNPRILLSFFSPLSPPYFPSFQLISHKSLFSFRAKHIGFDGLWYRNILSLSPRCCKKTPFSPPKLRKGQRSSFRGATSPTSLPHRVLLFFPPSSEDLYFGVDSRLTSSAPFPPVCVHALILTLHDFFAQRVPPSCLVPLEFFE